MKKEVSNRGFIILQYKEPYREWAGKWNDLGSADLESHLRCSRIYMIDFVDPDDVENVNDVIEVNYKIIFETELMSWNSIESEWPNNINFELFKEWFDFAATDIGYDLGNEPLAYDE
jgi:hypothetical protein